MSTEVFVYFQVFKLLLHMCHLTTFYLNIQVITVGGLIFPVASLQYIPPAQNIKTFHMVNNMTFELLELQLPIFLLTDHIRSA